MVTTYRLYNDMRADWNNAGRFLSRSRATTTSIESIESVFYKSQLILITDLNANVKFGNDLFEIQSNPILSISIAIATRVNAVSH